MQLPMPKGRRYVLEGRPVLLPLEAVAHLGNEHAPPGAAGPWEHDELLRRAGEFLSSVCLAFGVCRGMP